MLRTALVVWGCYWGVLYSLHEVMPHLRFDTQVSAQAAEVFFKNIPWVVTLVAFVGAQILFFVWVAKCFRALRDLRLHGDRVAAP